MAANSLGEPLRPHALVVSLISSIFYVSQDFSAKEISIFPNFSKTEIIPVNFKTFSNLIKEGNFQGKLPEDLFFAMKFSFKCRG